MLLRLFRFFLQNAEDIALGIFVIREPADTGIVALGQGFNAASGEDFRDGLVYLLDGHRENVGVHGRTVYRRLRTVALQDAAVDARILDIRRVFRFRPGHNYPVINPPGEFVLLVRPSEDLAIELRRPLRVSRMNLEMYGPIMCHMRLVYQSANEDK